MSGLNLPIHNLHKSLQVLLLLGSNSSAFGGANFGARLSIFGVSDLGSSLPMRSGSEEKYIFYFFLCALFIVQLMAYSQYKD